MKVFITGSSGFIGSELVKHLGQKYEIIKYSLGEGQDILNFEQLKSAMKGCDVVVHLAAIKAPFPDKNWSEYFYSNCIGTFNVAEAALQNKVKRLIYASSTTYYGIENGIPFPKPIKESNPVVTQFATADALSCRDCDIAYSTSKVIAEQILANYGLMKKTEVIILRLGPTRPTGVFKPFLGTQVKIENVVQAIEKAIALDKQIWYEAITILDDIEVADISKAKNLLGYTPI